MCCTYPSIDPKYNRHEGMQVTCDKDLHCMQQFVATKQTCALPRHLNALGALGPWMTLTIYDLVAKLLYKMQPKVWSSKDRRPKRGTDDNIWRQHPMKLPKEKHETGETTTVLFESFRWLAASLFVWVAALCRASPSTKRCAATCQCYGACNLTSSQWKTWGSAIHWSFFFFVSVILKL